MKKISTLIFTVFALLAITSSVYANGTAASSTVANTAYISASNASTVNSSYDTVVAAIYGETTNILSGYFHTNSVVVGGTVAIVYQIQNTGNTSDSFVIDIGNLQYAGGSANWYHAIIDKNGSSQGTSFIIGPIAEDGTETFTIRIVSNSSIDSSPNGSQGYCTVAVSAYGKTLNQYTGDNGTVYASTNSSEIWTDSAMVSAAVFSLTKVCTGATLGGAVSLPVPGATLWYQITYSNTGSDSGNNVYIYDELDTSVVLFSDTTSGTANGWTFYYSSMVSPTPGYGVVGGNWTAGAPGTPANVRWVKWDKATVGDTEDNLTLGYKVIIK